MRVSEIIIGAGSTRVPKGRNLDRIGWFSGYLVVQFKGRSDRWIYGPDVPSEEMAKILRVPYPDSIFTTNIKNKFRCHKVGVGNGIS